MPFSDVADASTPSESLRLAKQPVTGCLSQAAPALPSAVLLTSSFTQTHFVMSPKFGKAKAGRTKQEDRRMFTMKPEAQAHCTNIFQIKAETSNLLELSILSRCSQLSALGLRPAQRACAPCLSQSDRAPALRFSDLGLQH